MREITFWLYDTGIINDIISGVIVAAIIATLAFIFQKTIVAFLKQLLPRLESKTPHVNFEVKNRHTKNHGWISSVTVSNAGDEPAYNVYVLYFEQFPDGRFKITGSGTDNLISRPVLGIRDRLEFETSGVQFEGCNVTCRQEIWVEYENSAGVNFRVVSHPPSPVGDIGRIAHPKIIKYRIDQIPSMVHEGSAKLAKKYEKGKVKPMVRIRRVSNLLWRIRYVILLKPLAAISNCYNRAKI